MILAYKCSFLIMWQNAPGGCKIIKGLSKRHRSSTWWSGWYDEIVLLAWTRSFTKSGNQIWAQWNLCETFPLLHRILGWMTCSYFSWHYNISLKFQTYTGNILIAINPFQRLPHLYDTHMMEQYKGAGFGELSPHVFAVADVAYRWFVFFYFFFFPFLFVFCFFVFSSITQHLFMSSFISFDIHFSIRK